MGIEAQEPPCRLCFGTRAAHNTLNHPYVGPNDEAGAALKAPERKKQEPAPRLIITPAPDLVLRQVLLKKGFIMPEELEATERELTLGVLGIKPAGDQTHDVQSDPGSHC